MRPVPFKPLVGNRDRPSARVLNQTTQNVNELVQSIPVVGLRDSSGLHTRQPELNDLEIKIFEVQSAATGDGVYNCYEQVLDSTNWIDTTGFDKFLDHDTNIVEVLNLLENDVEADYTPALALKDRIAAWEWFDDEGKARWVGIPLVPSTRRARTTQSATANDHITCNLIGNDGVEITSGLGSGIEVYCNISHGTALNDAIRRLANDDYLMVVNSGGKWWCTEGFSGDEECDCYSA